MQVVFELYPTIERGQRAVEHLRQSGYRDISLVTSALATGGRRAAHIWPDGHGLTMPDEGCLAAVGGVAGVRVLPQSVSGALVLEGPIADSVSDAKAPSGRDWLVDFISRSGVDASRAQRLVQSVEAGAVLVGVHVAAGPLGQARAVLHEAQFADLRSTAPEHELSEANLTLQEMAQRLGHDVEAAAREAAADAASIRLQSGGGVHLGPGPNGHGESM